VIHSRGVGEGDGVAVGAEVAAGAGAGAGVGFGLRPEREADGFCTTAVAGFTDVGIADASGLS